MRPPAAWTAALERLHEARVAGDVMRNPESPQGVRDAATQAYCHAVDALVANLGQLQADQTLGRITLFLSRRGGGL